MRKHWKKFAALILGAAMAAGSLYTGSGIGAADGKEEVVYAEEDSTQEFVIDENGVLTKYNGAGGDVVVPDRVTKIGDRAFAYCKNLTAVRIPEGVTEIGSCAFWYSENLANVVLPSSMDKIESQVFQGCGSLTAIELPENMASIGSNAFAKSGLINITIPNHVKSIEWRAFSDCQSLTKVVLPNELTTIEEETFLNCSNLADVTIPESVINIGESAFQGCSSLTDIDLSENLAEIEYMAFYGCRSLAEIVFPNSVQKLGTEAFASCDSLTNIILSDNLTEIGEGVFSSCSSLASIILPDKIVKIGDRAFENCSSLVNLVLPTGMNRIGERVFKGCSSLAIINLPENISSIGSFAFDGCSNLTEISLPSGLHTLERGVFRGCDKLDLKTLYSQSNLERIDYSQMDLEDIGVLAGCTGVKELDLGYNDNIKDINLLKEFTQLEVLRLGYNQISDISPLSGCANLKEVDLGNNQITDSRALADCKNLETVNLGNNQIIDISSMADWQNLREITLDYNQIEDVSIFETCPNLEYISLRNNKLSDLEQVKKIKAAGEREIYIEGNPIPDQDILDQIFQYNQTEEVVAELRKGIENLNAFSSDRLLSLLKDEKIEVVIEDPAIAEASCNYYGTIEVKGLQTGNTTLTVTCGTASRIIEIHVIEEIAAPDMEVEHVPSIETAWGDTAVVSWKGNSVWSVHNETVKKVADLKASDKKYIARLVYFEYKKGNPKADCLVLDENQQLWDWKAMDREKIDENVDTFTSNILVGDGKQKLSLVLAKDSKEVMDGTGDILFKLEQEETAVEMQFGSVDQPVRYCLTDGGNLYRSEKSWLSGVSEIREGRNSWMALMEDGYCYSYGLQTDRNRYDKDVLDTCLYWNESLKKYEEYIQYGDGWYLLDKDTGEKTLTEDREREESYHLTKEGVLYYNDTILLRSVSSFFVESVYKDLFVIRTDGSLWRSDGRTSMPELVNTLEELQNLPDVTVIPGDIDGDTKITLTDAQMALKAALKIIVLNEDQKKAADVDGSDGISLTDAQMILKAALKIITL